MTPLKKCSNAEIAKLLIGKGANVNIRNRDNETALNYAATAGLDDLVEVLLENGADVDNRVVKGNRGTPLMSATRYGNVKTMEVLLKHKANVNMTNNDGETALDYAKTNTDDEKEALLIAHGAKTGAELKADEQKLVPPADADKTK